MRVKCLILEKIQTLKHLCLSLFLKEIQTQVFSYEIYEILKNTYFEEHLRTTTSAHFITRVYFDTTAKNMRKPLS